MQKVMVIGCPGGGKSTFAKALARKTGLPLFHLDQMYWNNDKTTVSKEVFLERLHHVLNEERFIIDGNYESTLELRAAVCDTIFFLDYPPEVCLDGIETRKGKPRSDMPWFERSDEIDEEFLRFVKEYEIKSKPKVVNLLEKYADKKIVVFKTRTESEVFLSRM